VHRPVVTVLAELTGAIERIDDPGPGACQSGLIILALLRQHGIVGTQGGQLFHQPVMGTQIAGILDGAFLGAGGHQFGPHLEQERSCCTCEVDRQFVVAHGRLPEPATPALAGGC
jgi:hypothetical protein